METLDIQVRTKAGGRAALLALLVFGVSACTGAIGGSSDTGSGSTGPGSGAGTGTGSGTGTGGNGACTPTDPVAQRMVRLSFDQLANTIRSLIGPDALKNVSLDSPRAREFQALFVEGDLVNTPVLSKTVTSGDDAPTPLPHPAALSLVPAGASPFTDACASASLTTFAEKANRRPLTADET